MIIAPHGRKATYHHCAQETLLQGRWLACAQVIWLVLILLTITVFAMGVPETFHMALSLHESTRLGLEKMGLSAQFYAYYITLVDTITFVLFALFAILIFSRRPNDWMVMLSGLTMLLTSVLYTDPAFEAPVPTSVIGLLAALAEIGQVAFVFLFPNGRFVPRFLWILLIPLFVWRPTMWLLSYMPHFLSLTRSGENFYYIPQNTWDLALFLLVLGVGIVAQVYRYRYYSTPTQRQQTKWLVLGFALAVLIVGGYVIAINTIAGLQQLNSEGLLARLVSRTLNHLTLLLLPVMLTFAILRYHLWDIDTFINRTLVYGTLTATVVCIYLSGILFLQLLLGSVTKGNDAATIGATVAAALLFQPLRQRIQTMIDRRFYRHKYDAATTIETFSKELVHETDLAQLQAELVRVVDQTMQPDFVSLWFRHSSQAIKEHKTRALPRLD